jgi:hypothetical protein
LVGGYGFELLGSVTNGGGGEAQVCGPTDECRVIDLAGEQLRFQQRELHGLRSRRGIKHGSSPGGRVAATARPV